MLEVLTTLAPVTSGFVAFCGTWVLECLHGERLQFYTDCYYYLRQNFGLKVIFSFIFQWCDWPWGGGSSQWRTFGTPGRLAAASLVELCLHQVPVVEEPQHPDGVLEIYQKLEVRNQKIPWISWFMVILDMILLYSLCRMNTGSIFSSEISSRQGYFHQLLSLYIMYIMYIVVFLFSLGISWCLAGCSGDRTVRSSNGRSVKIKSFRWNFTRHEAKTTTATAANKQSETWCWSGLMLSMVQILCGLAIDDL